MRIVKHPVATKITPNYVKYHGTNVVTFNHDGSVTLRTGGWHTATTKQRMNQYAGGVYVFQKKFGWFVNFEGNNYPFVEGITLVHGKGAFEGAPIAPITVK